MRFPRWLYEWIDERGKIPWIVRSVLYPGSHFCPEMDDLLVMGGEFWHNRHNDRDNCFCGMWPENDATRWDRLKQNPPAF